MSEPENPITVPASINGEINIVSIYSIETEEQDDGSLNVYADYTLTPIEQLPDQNVYNLDDFDNVKQFMEHFINNAIRESIEAQEED